MPSFTLSAMVRRLRQDTPTGDGCSDADLLARFAQSHDNAAFELLVWRHGAMVLAACQRILTQVDDAEDAFQAVFLILARKARGISRGTALPAWLHRVAVRVAGRLVRSRQLPATLEVELAAEPVPDPTIRAETLNILDEEIDRLPEKCRQAVAFCYLEGLMQQKRQGDSAVRRVLSNPDSQQLEEKLRDQLTRRGLTLPVGVLAVIGMQTTLTSEAIAATARACVAFVKGETIAAFTGESPVRLAKGVLGMWRTRAWATATITTTAVVVVAMVGFGWAWAEQPPVLMGNNSPAEKVQANPASIAKADGPADPRFQKEWWGKAVPLGRLGGAYLHAISPDGKRMLLQHEGYLVCIDLGKESIVWKIALKTLHNAAFSPDGKLVATAQWEDDVKLYDAATGNLVKHFTAQVGHESRPDQVGFLPDGKLVMHTYLWHYLEDRANPKPDGTLPLWQILTHSLIVWDPATQSEVLRSGGKIHYEGSNIWQRLMGRGQIMQTLQAFTTNGRTTRKIVSYTDPLTRKCSEALELNNDDDHQFDLSPDGKTLLVMTVGKPPRLLDTSTGEVKLTLNGHQRLVTSGAFSPDGKLIATVSGTDISGYDLAKLKGSPPTGPSELIIRETETGKLIARYEYPTTENDLAQVGFSPDGRYVYAITRNREKMVVWGQLPFPHPAAAESVGIPKLPALKPQPALPMGPGVGNPGLPPIGGVVADALDKLIEELPKSDRPLSQQIDAIFLAALGRLPTTTEVKRITDKYGAKPTPESLRALLGELTSSPEFAAHVRMLEKRLPAKPMFPFNGPFSGSEMYGTWSSSMSFPPKP